MIARSDLDSDFQVWVPLASPKMLSVVGNDTEVIPCVWLELASGGCKYVSGRCTYLNTAS